MFIGQPLWRLRAFRLVVPRSNAILNLDADTAAFSDAVSLEINTSTADSFAASDSLTLQSAVQALEYLVAADVISHGATASLTATESAAFSETLQFLFSELASESMSASESLAVVLASQLIELILATDSTTHRATLSATVAEALVITEALQQGYSLSVIEAADIAETLQAQVSAVQSVLESMAATDSVTNVLSAIAVVSDSAALSDSLVTQLQATQLVSDGMVITVSVTIGGTEYIGIVLNTEGLQVSEYANWNFNSFAQIGDHYYGAKDDGIYLLEGDTDQGSQIAFYLKTGKTDFGADQMKAVDHAWIGYTSSGGLRLKTITSEGGELKEYWYVMVPSSNTGAQPMTAKIEPGKGLRSRYWQFELVNVSGTDIQISDITLHPILLKRRR